MISKWDLLAKLIIDNKYKVIVDIGISKGVTERGIRDILIIRKYNLTSFYGIDPYKDPYYAMSDSELQSLCNWSPFKFIHKTSDDALEDIPDNVDLVFVDGSHTPEQRIIDLINYSKKIRNGGMLVSHEYGLFITTDLGDYSLVTKFVDENIGINNFSTIQDKRLENLKPCFLFWTYIYRNNSGEIEYSKEPRNI